MAEGFQSAFVTGGSGFIGGRAVSAPGRRRRDRPRAGTLGLLGRRGRGPGRRAGQRGPPGSGGDDAGAEGCDVTFHLAAHVADWGPDDRLRRRATSTAPATRSRPRRRAGVDPLRPLRDRGGDPRRHAAATTPTSRCRCAPTPPLPTRATKAKAEALVRKAHGDGIETVVIRPRFVWGAGDTTLLPQITEAAQSRTFAWIDGGTHTHLDHPRRQRRRGARARRSQGRAAARPTSSPTARTSSSGSSSPSCSPPRASRRPTALCRPGSPARWRAAARSPGGRCR